ncbi:MAG: hypothetical protein IPJ77_13550 [Planctomycetes bacterium]|nr:hypothetical protein [Planctomycetota bacterium]
MSDTLELLLPEASEAARAETRRVTSLLRLLVDDAHAAHAHSVGVDLGRARRELELQSRGQLEATLRDLLRLHLEAARPVDCFLWFGEPAASAQRAWAALDDLRSAHDDLPGVPEPGETALQVAQRLLEALERHVARGGPDPEVALWRARWVRLAHGARAGELAFRALLDEPRAPGANATARSAVAGVAECLLDRGAVRDARQFLLERMPRVGATPRLRLLLAWSRLCLDDPAGARSVLVGTKPWAGPLPAQLVDLRERRREWLPMLTGRARSTPAAIELPPRVPAAARTFDRGELGASVLGLFAFRPGAGARCLAHDAAPGLRSRLEVWLDEHDGFVGSPGTLQHRLLVEARPLGESVDGPRANLGLLGRETTHGVFLEPVLDEDGEVVGWIHAEFEHHLLPVPARRAALAETWRERVLPEAWSRREDADPAPDAERSPCVPGGPIERAFEELVERLGIKTQLRLWWGFQLRGGEPELVAQGGLGQGFPERTWGRRRALLRALGASGPVLYEDADERLAVHAGASAGVVLLQRVCGRVSGLFVLESSRRRDFKLADLERMQAAADRAGLAHRVAEFREWHTLRFGHDLWFDADRGDCAEFARRLVFAARSASPLVLSGPPGAGKHVLARWAHFESGREDQPFCTAGRARIATAAHVHAELHRARGGTLVIEDVDQAPAEVQEEWTRVLEAQELEGAAREAAASRLDALAELTELDPPTAAPRLCFLLTSSLAAAAASGRLRGDLARRLDRLQLSVPPLCDRREDVLPLVNVLARRFAAEERVPVPELTEDAQALLWRQPWPGNVRELENLVFKLVLFAREHRAGASVPLDAAAVTELCRRNGLELVRRVPSRHPARRDLVAALRTTRTRGGRVNKTRSAQFLGWDPTWSGNAVVSGEGPWGRPKAGQKILSEDERACRM